MIRFLNSALLSRENKFCKIFIFPVICFLAFFLSINNDVFFRAEKSESYKIIRKISWTFIVI